MRVKPSRTTRRPPIALRLHKADTQEPDRILAACAGDEAARDWIVRHYTPPIYRFCYRLLRNEQDARDVSQETLLRVLRNLHRYDPKHRFTTWAFTIARNACIDLQRKRKRIGPWTDREVVDTAPSPLAQTQQRIRAERLERALQELPDMYREILVLYHFEHLKYTEIAAVLDIPLGTVMNRIFRARRKLRVIYEDQEAS